MTTLEEPWYLVAWRAGDGPRAVASGMTQRLAMAQAFVCKTDDPETRYFIMSHPSPLGAVRELTRAETQDWRVFPAGTLTARRVRGAVWRLVQQELAPLT